MNSLKTQTTTNQLLEDYVNRGGKITVCRPKLTPKYRQSKRKTFTREQLKAFVR